MGVKGKSKYTYEEIKQKFEEKGYELLSTELCLSNAKLDYICPKHRDKGVQHISIYHIIEGKGCYYCGRERTEEGRRAKINKDKDKKLCEGHGFEYVDTIVENYIVWIDMICPKHKYVGIQRIKKGNLQREKTCSCVYCIGRKIHPSDSFGTKFPEYIDLWSEINDKTPFELAPHSNQKMWFKCENNLHKDYLKPINEISRRGLHCPECARLRKESYLQEKVSLYFEKLGYQLFHEYECSIIDINPITNYKMPYDNQENNELKLIIEVNGKQHYEVDKFTIMQARQQNKTPEEILEYQQWKDRHKKEFALLQGYDYLEIPFWSEQNDEYKHIIDEKINNIKNKNCFNN